MKATFKSNDEKEINRIVKSLDMACFIFQLTNNTKKSFFDDGETAYNQAVEDVFNRIYEMLEEYNINIDDLIE